MTRSATSETATRSSPGSSIRRRLAAGARTVATAVAALALAGTAQSDVVVDLGLHRVPEGATGTAASLPVTITGNETLTDMAAVIQLGDGGPLVGGTPAPRITAIDLDDSIWESAPGGFVEFVASSTPPAQIVDPSVSLATAGESVATNGILLTLTVDVSGFPPGDYPIRMTTTAAGDTVLLRQQNEIPATFIEGVLRIVPAKTWWQQTHFGDDVENPFLEATVWGDSADPDGDDRTNLEEFVFGTDPHDTGDPEVTESTPGTPALTFTDTTASLLVSRRRESTPSASIEAEISFDLTAWSTEDVAAFVIGDLASGEFERVAFLYTGPDPRRAFFRPRVIASDAP